MAHDHAANYWRIIHHWCLNHCHLQLLLHHRRYGPTIRHFGLSQLSHYPLLKIGQRRPISIPVRIFLQGDALGLWSTTSTSSAHPRLRPHSRLTGTAVAFYEAQSPHPESAKSTFSILHKDSYTEHQGQTLNSTNTLGINTDHGVYILRGFIIFQHQHIARWNQRQAYAPWDSWKISKWRKDVIRTSH